MGTLYQAFHGKRVHILGCAGTLMGSFAVALSKEGVVVTGSDQNIYPPMSDVLAQSGVRVFLGYSPENLKEANPDLVIVGNVIRKINPEMEAVVASGLPYLSLPATFEKMILPSKHSLVVAGTHGKTTTTSLMTWILQCLGEDPSFFIGGVPHNFKEGLRVTNSKFMVLEGDEYDTAYFDKVPKFTHYRPTDVILTSVEFDHADIYKDLAAVEDAFMMLVRAIPKTGHLIVCAHSAVAMKLSAACPAKVVSYGFVASAQERGQELRFSNEGTHFIYDGVPVDLPMAGEHNALNALACLVLVKRLGLNLKRAAQALTTFKGIKRRQEIYTQVGDTVLIDDFAHHPTAVKETLVALRNRYKDKRIVAFFEPRSATSRRKIFQKEYAASFDAADVVFIARPYDQSQISSSELFSSQDLVSDLKHAGKNAHLFETANLADVYSTISKGDLVVVMSNGAFDGLLPKLKDFIHNNM
jgi:UDP-N-acetylmuramate: L-alanyl-gamma-D-glutamyl-meso-diaminopimelate ligase